MKKKPLSIFVIFIVLTICIYSTNAVSTANIDIDNVTESAQIILEKADEIRFPRESFQVDVSINTSTPNQANDIREYRVLSKGNKNSIVMTTAPASDRGQTMLMRGRDLWIFMPSVSQPIRLSLSQRLTGQVANGDIARANFSGDYTPKFLRTETIEGEEYNVLELVGVNRSVTYHKVLFWVQKLNYWPYRAEFYSLSGRLLKTSQYQNFQLMLGQLRPTRLVMEDALREDEVSVLDYSEMSLRDLPDKVFTKNYLKRLE